MKKRLIMNLIFIFLCLVFSFNIASAKTIKVKKIKINKTKKSIVVGKSFKLKYKILPNNANNKKVKITSSNKNVAVVKANGKIKAKNPGKATIIIKSKSNKKIKRNIKLTVKEDVNKQEKSDKEDTNSNTNSTISLKVQSSTDSQQAKTLLALSDTGLATVKTPTAIEITDEIVELDAGETYQLQANLLPIGSTGKIVWSTEHIGGINLYSNGSVYVTDDTPEGTKATVYAICGGLKASCIIICKGADHEHTWQEASRQEATCMHDGIINYRCEVNGCNRTKNEIIEALGHSWDQGTITKEATCSQTGIKTIKCTRCGEQKEEEVPVKGHTWNQGEIITEPTCTNKGKKRYTCTICRTTKDVSTDAKGHTWDAGEVTKEPSCDQTGTITYTCTVEGCTGTRSEIIPAHGHTYDYGEITVEPTCTSSGRRVSTCLTCGKEATVTLAPLKHSFDEGVVTTEPTCTEYGVKTYTCTREGCGSTYTESIPKLGHNYATVTDENGNEDYVYTIEREPTCEVRGRKSAVCTRCGYKNHAENIPPLGHDWDEGQVTKEPKCTTTGMRVHTCKREGCGVTKEVVIANLGHDWEDEYTIDEYATCTKAGKKSIHCSRCSLTRDICAVPALGHDYGSGVVKQAATCTKEGIMHYICQRNCGMWKDEPIKALGHDYAESFTTDLAPTCTEPGSKSRHCARCDNKGYITVIPAKGHEWGAWANITEATCTLAGLRERICSTCNEVQKEGIEANGHIRSNDGSCQNCDSEFAYKETEAKDWTYIKDDENETIILKQYIGREECIVIPEKLTISEKNGSVTIEKDYTIKGFKANSGNPQSSTFTSSQKLVKVKAVKFESGVDIEDISYLFANCEKLEEVEGIPNSVTKADHAFENCPMLNNIIGGLPAGLKSMTYCFKDCTSLQSSPTIPAGIISLDSVYKGDISLKIAPIIPDGVEDLSRTFSGCSSLYMPPLVPDSVTSLLDTFRECTELQETANVPENVSELVGTYYGCTSLKIAPLVPENIISMKYTYMNCTNLTYAAPLPFTVKEKEDVFTGCTSL